MTHTELGRLYYEFDDLDRAEAHIQAAIRRSERGGLPRIGADGHILMAIVRQARGDFAAAQAAMRKAEALIEQYHLPLRYRGLAMRTQMLLSLANGDLAAAERWPHNSAGLLTEALDYPQEEERVALAYLLVAQGRYGEATAFLTRLCQFVEAQGRFYQVLKILALQAKAFFLAGDHSQALATLERALVLAAPEGFVRVFIDQGEAMRFLIADFRFLIVGRTAVPNQASILAYIDKLLAAFTDLAASVDEQPIQNPKSQIQNLVEPLSERELDVLRLLAVGSSNQVISEQLIISLNTVKSHVRNIYDKLGVNNRMQAVAQARALGLL